MHDTRKELHTTPNHELNAVPSFFLSSFSLLLMGSVCDLSTDSDIIPTMRGDGDYSDVGRDSYRLSVENEWINGLTSRSVDTRDAWTPLLTNRVLVSCLLGSQLNAIASATFDHEHTPPTSFVLVMCGQAVLQSDRSI